MKELVVLESYFNGIADTYLDSFKVKNKIKIRKNIKCCQSLYLHVGGKLKTLTELEKMKIEINSFFGG